MKNDIRQAYVRMSEDLHKALRIEAAKDDVSLNACIVTLLTEALEARRVFPPIDERKSEQRQS
ncbi:toxin-antitoxin system HicB family antitoxin [Cloacibacillus sp. An23]|uniref:toxin-antitoxin system HicB family antitoxin n=1 Tax=Cloacibacillus sp. An23 TaxID=1965591 RepID=UPI000B375B2C|nr:toxin-antitoxin system HicB family antitoxin [Cloacibacillus sp. An23]OUO94712.1 hypothetical protein B5F39_02260 [Cloacibacillus sp. An23]